MQKKLTKVVLFVLLFLLHLGVTAGGTLFASLGLYALLAESELTRGVGAVNAVGCLVTGLCVALTSFVVTPRMMGKVIKW